MQYIQKGVIKMENRENKIIKSTPAQLRANKKYDRNHYKTITYKSKISDYEQIKAYAESKNISIYQLVNYVNYVSPIACRMVLNLMIYQKNNIILL